MIDTHCHLTDERLFNQIEDVLARAKGAGVKRVITIGTDLEDDRAAIRVCEGRDDVRCAIGIHPNHSKDSTLADVAQLRELQKSPSVVALGEMGMDYHHNFSPRDQQRKIFEAQLDLATQLDRPVVIHCREAIDDTLAIMRAFPKIRAVFHSFTGSKDEAVRIVAAGYLIGFTGPVTYKKNDDLREAVRAVPLERIVVETDAPYLSPEPMRKQKVNEPAFVMHTARMVAQLKDVAIDTFSAVSTATVQRFFGGADFA